MTTPNRQPETYYLTIDELLTVCSSYRAVEPEKLLKIYAEAYWEDPREPVREFERPKPPIRQQGFDLEMRLTLVYPKLRGGVDECYFHLYASEWEPPRDRGFPALGLWQKRKTCMRGSFHTFSLSFAHELANAYYAGRNLGLVTSGTRIFRGSGGIREVTWCDIRHDCFYHGMPEKVAAKLPVEPVP